MLKVNHLGGFGKKAGGVETYPPLNAFTPIFSCGFECGQLGSSGQHWTTGTGASVSTEQTRYGARSLKFALSGQSSTVRSAIFAAPSFTCMVVRFYIRFASLPDANTILCWTNDNSAGHCYGIGFHASSNTLRCGFYHIGVDSYNFASSGASVTTNQWYRVDLKVTYDGSVNKDMYAYVDGVSIASYNWGQFGNLNDKISLGSKNTVTSTFYIDDFLHSGTAADYPLGAGRVLPYIPASDGAHNTGSAGSFKKGAAGANITNSTTDSYQLIDDLPLDDATPDTNDYIAQTNDSGGGSLYVEHALGLAAGITAPVSAPRAVEAVVAYHQENTDSGNCAMKLVDNGNENAIASINAAGSTSTTYARKMYANPPSGLGGWKMTGTNGNFTNLKHRFGYSSDGNPDQYLDCVLIEAEFPE